MIEHKECFSEFIEGDIAEYISKMLLNGVWVGHVELVSYSKIYNVSIRVYGSIGSEDQIIKF